jgi:TRAP transporter 4TM/12TM fusion protein
MLGWALPAVVIFFVIHALFTEHFPGILFGRAPSLERLTGDIYLGLGGIFGYPVWIAGTVVITFILFSQLLIESGAGHFFLNLALSLVGGLRGGPAKVAVVASSFFATLSGSPTANVVATGSITIPLMKNTGYPPHFAAAVEAVASKGGQLTPPIMGAVIFLMVEATGFSYLDIAIAAALPAFLYYFAIFLQVDFRAARTGLRGLSRAELPSLKQTLKEGWQYLIPLVTLVCLIAYRRHSPQEAALYSMVVLWIVSLFRRESRLGPSRIINGFKSGASTTLYAAIPCALAGVILASLSTTGLGLRFSGQVINLAGGNLAVLVGLAAISSFILGMGMTSIAIYIILAVLIAPSLVEMGVHILAAHLFIVFWGNISFITPPVAIAAFAAAGIAGADPMKTGWQASRLGIVSFLIPFMFVWNPNLILVGSLGEILLTAVTAIIGVALLASGVEGYMPGGKINWVVRALLLSGAILLLLPSWETDIIGLAVVLPIVLQRIRTAREAKLITPQRDFGSGR